jgi:hypothetical protein
VRWWNAVRPSLRKRDPASLTWIPVLVANSLVTDPMGCEGRPSLHLRIKNNLDFLRLVEIGGLRFPGC